MWFCKLCCVPCTSDYGKQQHLTGKKHRANLRHGSAPLRNIGNSYHRNTKPKKVCTFFLRGACRYGQACIFLHDGTAEEDIDEIEDYFGLEEQQEKSNDATTASSIIEGEFRLCKGPKGENSPNEGSPPKVFFSIFEKKATPTPKKKAPSSKFREIYRNAFKGRKNVNLSIRGGLVVWEFAYNTTIIAAIKEHIKGRAWNPKIGIKGCWTCPLESLGDAIELYEFMGRNADDELHQRAKEISQSLGSNSINAADIIKVNVGVDMNMNNNAPSLSAPAGIASASSSMGHVSLAFLYDAEIVSAIKRIPPDQRSYDPGTKKWTMDLLVLPELLEHLSELGYHPGQALESISASCNSLLRLLYQPGSAAFVKEERTEDSETNHRACEEDSRQNEVEAEIKSILQSLVESKGTTRAEELMDRSDCGPASKRRRLTFSQLEWSLKKQYGNDFDDIIGRFSRGHVHAARNLYDETLEDCDCGQPWKRSGGRHVCRYFGTFHCDTCGNQWTSGYTWKGEKQACRGCNKESLPVKTEPLKKREFSSTGGGPHDCARCTMCQKLGYDCSL